jgi:hypothetical protein
LQIALADKITLNNKGELPEIKKIYGKKDKEITISGSGVIRNAKTGKFIRGIVDGKGEILKPGEVFIEGGVQLVPTSEHAMKEAVAISQSVIGYYTRVNPKDYYEWNQIVFRTRKDIKKSMAEVMDTKGVRDYSRHYAQVDAILGKAINEVNALAKADAISTEQIKTPLGSFPLDKQTYGMDFLMALLHPEPISQKNRAVYYNKETRSFLPAVQHINPTVQNAVFNMLRNYEILPDYQNWLGDFAKTTSMNYKLLNSGRDFLTTARELKENTFEGALTNKVIDNVLYNPFMSTKDYRTWDDFQRMTQGIDSEFAELWRQIIQDDIMVDHGTLMRLKNRTIQSEGQQAYESMWKYPDGEIIHDGIAARRYDMGKGEGQLLGNIFKKGFSISDYETPISHQRINNRGSKVEEYTEQFIARQNWRDGEAKAKKQNKTRGDCE